MESLWIASAPSRCVSAWWSPVRGGESGRSRAPRRPAYANGAARGEAWDSANPFRRRSVMAAVNYRTIDVDGLKIFYREAGAAGAPHLLLLHGFPSASHMFRDLIPLLANRFHVIA